MSLKGITATSGRSSTYIKSADLALTSSSEESVSCEVPKTEAEECEVARLAKSATPKAEYNQTLGSTRYALGAAYLLYVIPGVIGYYITENQREKAMGDSLQLKIQQENACPKQISQSPINN